CSRARSTRGYSSCCGCNVRVIILVSTSINGTFKSGRDKCYRGRWPHRRVVALYDRDFRPRHGTAASTPWDWFSEGERLTPTLAVPAGRRAGAATVRSSGPALLLASSAPLLSR